MSKPVIWSPSSEKDFISILNYLKMNWGITVERNFIDISEKLVIQISNNPRQFPLIQRKKKVRKCIITKHNTLFYRDKQKFVEIIRIYDTRQDPNQLKFF